MRNWNYVCISCLSSARRAASKTNSPDCPHCGQQMESVGDEVRIPSKEDETGWKLLTASMHRSRMSVKKISRRAELETELRKLNARGLTDERVKKIQTIQEELSLFPKGR